MSTTRRRFLAGILASGAGLSLAACASDLPTVTTPTGTPVPHPALDGERLSSVLARITKGLASADKAKDAKGLEGFLTGPAARVRGEEYAIASASGDDKAIHALTLTSQAGAVGLTTDFPRTAMVVTEAGNDDTAPYLLTLTQDSARDNFALWNWVRLFAGVQIPETSTASVGSEQVGPDTTGLVSTPAEVLDAYVDALNNPDGDNGKAFADDALRQRIAAERKVTDSMNGFGNVTVSAAAGNDGIKGLRTTKGGAIVSATLTFSSVYTLTTAGAKISVSGNVAALAGDAEVKGTITATYDVMVAFSIPGEKTGGKPVALGTDLVLAKVERDDSKAPA